MIWESFFNTAVIIEVVWSVYGWISIGDEQGFLPNISSCISMTSSDSRLWWCHGKTWWNIRQKTLFFVPLQHWFTHKRIKLLRLSPQCWKMTLESTIFQLFFQVTVVVQQFLSLTKKMHTSQLASSVGVKIVEMQKTPMSCSSFLFTSSGFIKFATDIDWLWCKMSSLLCINYWMIQITNNVAIYCIDKKNALFFLQNFDTVPILRVIKLSKIQKRHEKIYNSRPSGAL